MVFGFIRSDFVSGCIVWIPFHLAFHSLCERRSFFIWLVCNAWLVLYFSFRELDVFFLLSAHFWFGAFFVISNQPTSQPTNGNLLEICNSNAAHAKATSVFKINFRHWFACCLKAHAVQFSIDIVCFALWFFMVLQWKSRFMFMFMWYCGIAGKWVCRAIFSFALLARCFFFFVSRCAIESCCCCCWTVRLSVCTCCLYMIMVDLLFRKLKWLPAHGICLRLIFRNMKPSSHVNRLTHPTSIECTKTNLFCQPSVFLMNRQN